METEIEKKKETWDEKYLEECSWHETGHVVIGFLHRIVPTTVFIQPPCNGYTVYLKMEMVNMEKDILLAGQAWVKKYMKMEDEGFHGNTIEESDWFRLGKPSKELVEKLTKELLDHTAFTDDVSKKIHDMIVKNKGISLMGLETIYVDFKMRHRNDCLEYEKWYDSEGWKKFEQFRRIQRKDYDELDYENLDYAEDTLAWE